MSQNGLYCADVPLRNYSATHSLSTAALVIALHNLQAVLRLLHVSTAALITWRRQTHSLLAPLQHFLLRQIIKNIRQQTQ